MGVTLISLMGVWRRDRLRRPAACGVVLMLAPIAGFRSCPRYRVVISWPRNGVADAAWMAQSRALSLAGYG
jgi:hypothetical protein